MKSAQPARPDKSFWTPTRAAVTIVVLSLLAAFGAASCNSTDSANSVAKQQNAAGAPAAKVNPQAGKTTAPAPAPGAPSAPASLPQDIMNRELTTLDGHSIKLSDFSGKVIVMNLWATWCGPCRIETPELVKLNREYKAKGVELIGVTTMENDPNLDAVKQFVHDQNVDYKVVYTEGSFVIPLIEGRNVIPQSFVISRDGRMLKHFVGFSATQTPTMLREAIDQALNSQG